MRIGILTAYFLPIQTPRAFRAYELAEEFANLGHEVKVFNAITVRDFDYTKMVRSYTLENLDILTFEQTSATEKKRLKSNRILSFIRYINKNLLYYSTTNTWLKYYFRLRSKLIINEKYDLFISIGLPFHSHWVLSKLIKKNKELLPCTVADYGDPFSTNQLSKVAPYFKLIEKRVLTNFDYISVPINEAISSFSSFKHESNIKVIPQGFNFDAIKTANYIKKIIPTFGYAGLFYCKIRNPKLLFDYLCELDSDFMFILYTDVNVLDNMLCIQPYITKLGNKLIVNPIRPREEVILELSKMDFLINVNNISKNQNPSKLIDYALSKRPVFTMNQNYFDKDVFNRYLQGDYSDNINLNIECYNIKNIANNFIALTK